MSDVAIRVASLAKSYRIGERIERYKTLRDTLAAAVRSPLERIRSAIRQHSSTGPYRSNAIWALKDISFEIKRGEVVGIIGRNGAGKSTLLKVLSRITDPTSGFAEVYGRVGSLLEVGTGFHPELTGRENIFLNGAILGMRRAEIEAKFDEIVAFAEVDQFVDTPVKHYSSGMYLRLAFAVAAYLETEILLVDEVLAVGDVAFQNKCLGKMKDVADAGRTVLFVSHNMGAVQALCTRALTLQNGHIADDGCTADVVREYLLQAQVASTNDIKLRTDRKGKGDFRVQSVEVYGTEPGSALMSGAPAHLAFALSSVARGGKFSFTVHDSYGHPVMDCVTRTDTDGGVGASSIACDFEEFLLAPGQYRVDVWLSVNGSVQDQVEGACMIQVHPGQIRGEYSGGVHPLRRVCLPHRWSIL